jgi:hypothetical protein
VDYWAGWNEFNPMSVSDWQWYATFEARRACALQANGLRAAMGSFGVGWPNAYGDMAYFLPALEAAHRCGGLLAVHEYDSPTFECGVAVGVPNIIAGAPPFDVPAGYHTLRYRLWYEGYLKPRGLGDLPLVITELAIQGPTQPGGPCNDPGGIAWKAYQQWWVQQGYGPDGPQAYVNLLAWYDAQIRQDSYVIGAAIFTAGGSSGDLSGWNIFDIHDVMIPLAQYAAQLP